MQSSITRLAGLGLAAGLAITSVAACGGGGSTSSGGSASGGGASGKKIALLLPESKTARYESKDRPLFKAAIKAQCATCQIIYSNADQDAAKQQQQAESALTQGADVLVLDPVDSKAAASIATTPRRQGAGDRLRPVHRGCPRRLLRLVRQREGGPAAGAALVDLMKKSGKTSGKIVMINGSPTDNNAGQFKKGAHSVLDESGYTVAGEYDTPDWSPDKAQEWMESQLTNVKTGLAGVYAANDGTAGGAIAALKGGGVNPLPPVTGQDAELAAIQRILTGDQAMTVYKAIKPEAEDAAEAALALADGRRSPTPRPPTRASRPRCSIPVAVTKDNVKDTVVKDGVYKVGDICTGEFAKACAAAGIS